MVLPTSIWLMLSVVECVQKIKESDAGRRRKGYGRDEAEEEIERYLGNQKGKKSKKFRK